MNLNNTNVVENKKPEFYRFQVVHGSITQEGKFEKTKTVGMAYIKDGQTTYTLRLWTFLNDRFYLIATKNDPSRYLIMTREPNKISNARNKYFWNIVGNGAVDSIHGVLCLNFDLLEKPIFMNLFPESSAHSQHLPEPASFENVA